MKKDLALLKNTRQLAEYREMFQDIDWEGFFEQPTVTYCQIRQKDLLNDKGAVEAGKGTFKFNDPEKMDVKELNVIVLLSSPARVWFDKIGDTMPKCKSANGFHSLDGKDCLGCVHSFWKEGKTPECRELRHLLVVDPAQKPPEPFIVVITGSGLKPWKEYYSYLRRKVQLPPYAFVTRVTNQFETVPAPYFSPVFDATAVLEKKDILQIKKQREQTMAQFANLMRTIVIRPEMETEEEEEKTIEQKLNTLLADPRFTFSERKSLIMMDIEKAYKEAQKILETK